MFKSARVYLQYLVPQHLLSVWMGKLADVKTPWLKNWMIKRFIKKYHINMQEAAITDPSAYATFNDFFIRKLANNSRPIDTHKNVIVSPADGTIAQVGIANKNELIQAKGFHFTLEALLGNDNKCAQLFHDGAYATIYLAPSNYHRVHMPLNGSLRKTIFVPGKLFSVNADTANHIPNLYARNERFIMIFETDIGKVAVIFVGAMIVGSIQPAWLTQPVRGKQISTVHFTQPLAFNKGDELGYFNLGSTVILLFEKNHTTWDTHFTVNHPIKLGEKIALFSTS